MRILLAILLTAFFTQSSFAELFPFSCTVANSNETRGISGQLDFGQTKGVHDIVLLTQSRAGKFAFPVNVTFWNYSNINIDIDGTFVDEHNVTQAVKFHVTSPDHQGSPLWTGHLTISGRKLEVYPLNCSDER